MNTDKDNNWMSNLSNVSPKPKQLLISDKEIVGLVNKIHAGGYITKQDLPKHYQKPTNIFKGVNEFIRMDLEVLELNLRNFIKYAIHLNTKQLPAFERSVNEYFTNLTKKKLNIEAGTFNHINECFEEDIYYKGNNSYSLILATKMISFKLYTIWYMKTYNVPEYVLLEI